MIKQLNVVKGQVEGVKTMLISGSDCVSIVTQLKAIKNALNKIGSKMIAAKFKECLAEGKNKVSESELDAIMESLAKY